ncbi:MAG TPA: hypothetical protein VN822_13290 [Candidatus Acidoferrales bacterium]|nr:hypothetical protein [Candidatus Acidoferrales bacterium]
MAQSQVQSTLHNSLCTVLNPLGQPTGVFEPSSMAPRLDTLGGKTVYLVDVGFAGGYEFLEELRAWFSRNMPAVETLLRRKKGNMFLDDPELWAEVRDKGHAVIFGVGG